MPKERRILVSCGTGIATSTAAAVKLKELLRSRGFQVTTTECKAAEVVSKAALFRPHAIVSTTHVSSAPVKVFNGLPLITGVGVEKLIDEIATFLDQQSG